LRLGKPIPIGPLTLSAVAARDVSPDAPLRAPAADADPDEIVVQAARKRARSDLSVTLGRDILGSCRTIIFDKASRTITLDCAGG
jgi:hypothetical protein